MISPVAGVSTALIEGGQPFIQFSAAVVTVTNCHGSKAHRFVACETGSPAGVTRGLNPDGVAGWDLMTGTDVSSENCTDRRCRRIETIGPVGFLFSPCIFKRNFIGRTFGGIEMAYLKDDDSNESPVKSDGNTSDSAHSTSYQARST